MNRRNIIISILTGLLTLYLTSCEDALKVDQKAVVSPDENYKSEFDSKNMANGIMALFQDQLGDMYVLLNELRGDLLDITYNADEYMREISEHNVSSGNPYIDPSKFYKVILSCNDALENLEVMYSDGIINDNTYERDYSEIISYRSYTYYLLSIHFGPVPYITESLDDISEINNKKFRVLTTNEMMLELLNTMITIPDYTQRGLEVSVDDYPQDFLQNASISKNLFLGDLHLWNGNYREAAVIYRQEMHGFTGSKNNLASKSYHKCSYGPFGYDFAKIYRTSWPPYNYWPNIFRLYLGGTRRSDLNKEWYWFCLIDERFELTNSLVTWFSNSYGSYVLKPSQHSINNWTNQPLYNGITGDVRGYNASWDYDNGQPVVLKYLYTFESGIEQAADLMMYRVGTLHLRYAEAANRAGYPELALSVLNSLPNSLADDPPAMKSDDDVFRFDSVKVLQEDETYLWEGLNTRENSSSRQYGLNYGVRGRVYASRIKIPSVDTLNKYWNGDSILYVEDIISNEYALELAYEGDRWQNLLRMALRRENETSGTGADFLINTISTKFEESEDYSGVPVTITSKTNINDWFLPLK